MGERRNAGYRDKMRDECVLIHAALLERRHVRLDDLAEEFGVSTRTIRRWVDSFSLVMPVRIEAGFVRFDEQLRPVPGRL